MDKYLVTGNCNNCGKELNREYTITVIKGIESLSDDYKLKMKCSCKDEPSFGNVPKSSIRIKQLLREHKLNQILE